MIAQACSCVFCLSRLAKLPFIRPSREDLRPQASVCARLMCLGLPISFQNGLIGMGGMIVQSVVNPLGVAFIAGYLSIRFFMKLISRVSLNGFAIYVTAIGILVIILQLTGVMVDAPVEQAVQGLAALLG